MICTKKRLWLCVTLLILNLLFIWGNSLLPGPQSAALSNWVKEILLRLFGWLFDGSGIGGGKGGLLRKLTHFLEFASLGVWLSWLFGMRFGMPVRFAALSFAPGVLVALADEGIQLFVPGRGPSFYDVGIDTLGLSLSVAAIFLIKIYKNSKYLEDNKR